MLGLYSQNYSNMDCQQFKNAFKTMNGWNHSIHYLHNDTFVTS